MKYTEFTIYGGRQTSFNKITDPVVKEVQEFCESTFEDFSLEMHKGEPITKFDNFYEGTLTIDNWGDSKAFISMPHIVRERLNKIFIEHCVYTYKNKKEYFEIHLSEGRAIRAKRFADCFKEFVSQTIEELKLEDMHLHESINWFVSRWEILPSGGKAKSIEYQEFV